MISWCKTVHARWNMAKFDCECRLKDTDLETEEAEAFARFDKDGDGVISLDDLKQVCLWLWG